LTLGGRYTTDALYNISYPIELLSAAPNNAAKQYVDPTSGLPAVGGFPSTICNTSKSACLVPQHVTYREFTGRANLDFTPTLSFTDKTLFYATYSRGYKGGGFNTPCQTGLGGAIAASCPYPLQYAPEFINAYEIGTKNTLLGGSLLLNADAFYYDYTGYQISQIIAKSSVNSNINSKIYGVEFEGVFSPVRNLTFNTNVGFLHSSINSGQSAVDTLNFTHGNPNYTVVKVTDGSNCVANTADVAAYVALNNADGKHPAAGLSALCAATGALSGGIPYDLGGKKMPNTPDFTVSVGAQYVFDLPGEWKATLRGDFYFQDNSFARIYNAVEDRLNSYEVVNATLTFANVVQGVDLQLFVKNAFNAQPLTGTYVTDASSGLFQNTFTLDPRTYGAQLTKRF
ncbi:MAG: TonB-dependent receptor, partial [Caulobacteraceae bacterium]